MKIFLGFIILTGFVRKSEKDEYWSTDPLLCTLIFEIPKYDEQEQIPPDMEILVFSNNENCQDRLDKIKPVVTYLTEKFQTVYKLKRELSLDERIIPWQGREDSHFVHIIQLKI